MTMNHCLAQRSNANEVEHGMTDDRSRFEANKAADTLYCILVDDSFLDLVGAYTISEVDPSDHWKCC